MEQLKEKLNEYNLEYYQLEDTIEFDYTSVATVDKVLELNKKFLTEIFNYDYQNTDEVEEIMQYISGFFDFKYNYNEKFKDNKTTQFYYYMKNLLQPLKADFVSNKIKDSDTLSTGKIKFSPIILKWFTKDKKHSFYMFKKIKQEVSKNIVTTALKFGFDNVYVQYMNIDSIVNDAQFNDFITTLPVEDAVVFKLELVLVAESLKGENVGSSIFQEFLVNNTKKFDSCDDLYGCEFSLPEESYKYVNTLNNYRKSAGALYGKDSVLIKLNDVNKKEFRLQLNRRDNVSGNRTKQSFDHYDLGSAAVWTMYSSNVLNLMKNGNKTLPSQESLEMNTKRKIGFVYDLDLFEEYVKKNKHQDVNNIYKVFQVIQSKQISFEYAEKLYNVMKKHFTEKEFHSLMDSSLMKLFYIFIKRDNIKVATFNSKLNDFILDDFYEGYEDELLGYLNGDDDFIRTSPFGIFNVLNYFLNKNENYLKTVPLKIFILKYLRDKWVTSDKIIKQKILDSNFSVENYGGLINEKLLNITDEEDKQVSKIYERMFMISRIIK